MRSLTPYLILACLLATTSPASAAQPLTIADRLELFVDDFLVGSQQGDLTQHLHRPEPQDVALTTDAPWEGNTCAYYSVFRDGDTLRMYYRGSHWDEKAKRAAHEEVTCYAESKDGVHWEKPELGVHEWEGSKANNIVLKGLGTHCFVAFKDANPNCAADAKYKGISRGRPVGKRGLYVYKSPDAIHWTLIKNEPVITDGAFDSQNLAFWDPVTKQYVDYHRIFTNGVRAIMTCTSNDFVNWTKPQLLKYGDAPNQHLYTNAIRPYPRAPHIRIGFPTRYLPEGSRVEPLFMSSRDGLNFKRFNKAVIPQSAPRDRAGNRSNYMANGLVSLPGKPNEYSVYASEAYYTGPDSRLRRFTFRVDGFVSLRAGAEGGELVTKPLRFSGDRLVLNYQAGKGGEVRVELQDEKGAALPGFELAACKPLAGDSIAAEVRWKNRPLPAGETIKVRFVLKNADLYSLQFRE